MQHLFLPDGRRVVAGEGNGQEQRGCIACWGVRDDKHKPREGGHQGRVLGVRFSPSGESFITAGYDQMIKFWTPPPSMSVSR